VLVSSAGLGRRQRLEEVTAAVFLASRFAAAGSTVNALAPALITEMGMLPGNPDELRGQVPVGWLGHPAEVAGLALAMLSNGYLTNQVISLDGGVYPR
jgi:3-oxoacyl-[acyl-carrier protein] reductase